MYKYLTTEPLPPTLITPITDQTGNVIAIWTSTNQRQPIETAEVEEAVRWASKSKWMEWRRGSDEHYSGST